MNHKCGITDRGETTDCAAAKHQHGAFAQKQQTDGSRWQSDGGEQSEFAHPALNAQPEQQADQNGRRQNQEEAEADKQAGEIVRPVCGLQSLRFDRSKHQSG